jgi:1-acyl-sn-glycerol-3-phosphate acyltransferase
MLKLISAIILKLIGWKIVGEIPKEVRKAVVISAPHTSNLDFVIGRLGLWYKGYPVHFLIKKEAFKPAWLGWIIKKAGGIPVDRSKSSSTTKKIAEELKKRDHTYLIITPEGTRSLARTWKKGFYYIAQEAGIPIVLGFVDYPRKQGGFGPVFYPTGDYDKDIKEIQKFYYDKGAKHPERFNLSPENRARFEKEKAEREKKNESKTTS